MVNANMVVALMVVQMVAIHLVRADVIDYVNPIVKVVAKTNVQHHVLEVVPPNAHRVLVVAAAVVQQLVETHAQRPAQQLAQEVVPLVVQQGVHRVQERVLLVVLQDAYLAQEGAPLDVQPLVVVDVQVVARLFAITHVVILVIVLAVEIANPLA